MNADAPCLSAAKLSAALDLAEGWVRDRVVPGVAVAVARHGVLVGERYAGRLAAGGGAPVDAGTLYPVASVTKPFTAAAALRLVERGDLALDEPVRRLVPAFAAGPGDPKREIAARDLLRHTAGLPQDDPAAPRLWDQGADFAALTASAAALPLAHPPGRRVAYSSPGYWVLGAAVAAAAGAPFAEVVRGEVLDRCCLAETFLDPSPALAPRIARRYGRAKVSNTPYGRALASPAGGLFATARDLVRFAGICLAGGRRPDGGRALSAASVALMTTDQTGGLPGGIAGLREWPACPWGLGWEVRGAKAAHWTGDLASPAAFAHLGQSGCLLWADPAGGLAVAVLANRDLATGWTLAPARWARLANALVAALATGPIATP